MFPENGKYAVGTGIPTLIPTIPPTATPKPKVTVAPTVAPTGTPLPIEAASVPDDVPVVTEAASPEPTVEPDEIEAEEVEDEEAPNIPVKKKTTPKPTVQEVEPEIPSSNPKTGDNTNLLFWIISVLISAGAVAFTGRDLFMKKKEK